MPTVDVSFTPLPAHVRTARLVALAVARRAGGDEEMLDEVRLAVSEACSRAVGVHRAGATDRPVRMLLTDDTDRFTIEVQDAGVVDPAAVTDDIDPDALSAPSEDGTAEALPPGFGLAVISGLVENVEVTSDDSGTRVTMTWPSPEPLEPSVG
jgi:anti-sigma regulatory factor (Ser/Thr protein kinase)